MMRFNTDEIKPFYEVRQSLSKAVDQVAQDSSEIVIAKHGKPVAALLSAEGLYRYRELDRLLVQLLEVLERRTDVAPTVVEEQLAAVIARVKSAWKCV